MDRSAIVISARTELVAGMLPLATESVRLAQARADSVLPVPGGPYLLKN